MVLRGFVFLLLSSFLLSGCQFLPQEATEQVSKMMTNVSTGASQPTPTPFENYTAQFEIFTRGTKRIFTQAMYLEQSSTAYLTSDAEGVVHVTQADITWGDFFSTLPFSITSECLITGTGQEFCSGENGKLSFVLNGQETPDALDHLIQPNDLLLIRFE